MASIEKRGEHNYRLTTCCGYDAKGRKKYKKKSIKISKNLTARQLEKELERQKILFEEEVNRGLHLDGNKITFGEYAVSWYYDYAKKHLAVSTLPNYKVRLNERIIPELGHIKLSNLQPVHLEGFYEYLLDEGVRLDVYYQPKTWLVDALKDIRNADVEKHMSMSVKTFIRLRNGERTTLPVATRVCAYFKVEMTEAFDLVNRQAKLSAKTIKHHHDLISTILSDAMRNNLILSNPAKRVRPPKLSKSKVSFYDGTQLARLFDALEAAPQKYRTIVYLTIDTGLRISEVAGLRWNHIRLDEGMLRVEQQRQRVSKEYGGILVKSPKTEHGVREISLSPTVVQILRGYREYQESCLESLGNQFNDEDYVFTHETGEPISPSRPYQWLVEFTKKHDLPKLTFHGLRHTNASLLISADTDLVTLSGRLGHADKNVTLNVYTHMIRAKERQVANKMEQFYPKAASSEEIDV